MSFGRVRDRRQGRARLYWSFGELRGGCLALSGGAFLFCKLCFRALERLYVKRVARPIFIHRNRGRYQHGLSNHPPPQQPGEEQVQRKRDWPGHRLAQRPAQGPSSQDCSESRKRDQED
jgi:hypothetical protein